MNIIGTLTLRHMKLNRKRSVITVIGIVLSVAMVTAISGMVVSFQDMLYRDSVAREGLWHVRYYNLDEATTEAVLAEPVFSTATRTEADGLPVLELQFGRLHKGIFDESEDVCIRLGIPQEQVKYHNNLLIAKGIVPGPYYGALYGFAGVLLVLVGVGSVLVISNAFSISADQRGRQFGLLKSAGATKKQIRGIVLAEGVVLAAIAIPLGIGAGFFAEWVALTIANRIIESIGAVNFMNGFRVVVSPLALSVSVGAACLTILLAAWVPARRASNVSAVDSIRQAKTVRIPPRSLRVSPLTARLFGFEGVLAAKTMKRNRPKYRTTVLSLVVSIVLYVGVSSFADMLMKSTGMMFEDVGYNVHINIVGGTQEEQDGAATEMMAWESLAAYTSRSFTATADIPREMLSAQTVEHFGLGPRRVTVYSMGDEQFRELCQEARRDPADYGDPDQIRALLINDIGTYIKKGRRINFTPYEIPEGTVIEAGGEGWSRKLTIHGELGEVPAGLRLNLAQFGLNVIVPESVRKTIQPPDQPTVRTVAVLSEDSAATTARAEELLGDRFGEGGGVVTDLDALMANNRNIGLLVMIFVYGFIAMLSLIGVTNVITTISTSIGLRRREFAMLRSTGMTRREIGKMLSYESLLYGAKALLYGIPLGFVTSRLMYGALITVMDFAYIPPVSSALIAALAVLALTFITMSYARSKQRKDNIVDALREEIA